MKQDIELNGTTSNPKMVAIEMLQKGLGSLP